ncbi:glucuronate isomerase, partial [Saliphagus infecundisoli]
MGFIDDDYLLETEAARSLYGEIADLPIVDPHTHADVREIVDDDGWDDVWEVEGATDHYVWALMRNRGVPERRITGDASNREKWEALAEVFPSFAGNPTYEWIHLDLRRRFGIEERISGDTAEEIWAETRSQLADDSMRPQSLLREMGVELLCSTDDPTSSLEYHDHAAEEIEDVSVLPTWRADRALQPGTDDWAAFRAELAESTGVP